MHGQRSVNSWQKRKHRPASLGPEEVLTPPSRRNMATMIRCVTAVVVPMYRQLQAQLHVACSKTLHNQSAACRCAAYAAYIHTMIAAMCAGRTALQPRPPAPAPGCCPAACTCMSGDADAATAVAVSCNPLRCCCCSFCWYCCCCARLSHDLLC
jgi:hypothetical protein